jgi:hypothetical protein
MQILGLLVMYFDAVVVKAKIQVGSGHTVFSLGRLIKEANIILTDRYFVFIKVQFLSNYNSVAAQMCMFCIVLTEIAHRRTYIH